MIIQKKKSIYNYISNLIFSKTIAYAGFKWLFFKPFGGNRVSDFLFMSCFFMTKIAKYLINLKKIIF